MLDSSDDWKMEKYKQLLSKLQIWTRKLYADIYLIPISYSTNNSIIISNLSNFIDFFVFESFHNIYL